MDNAETKRNQSIRQKSLSGKRVQLPNGKQGRVAGVNDDTGGWTLARGMEHLQLHDSFPTVVHWDAVVDDNNNNNKKTSGETSSVSRGNLIVLCDVCDQVSAAVCSKCKNQCYCSRECQKKDWKQHKKVCGK